LASRIQHNNFHRITGARFANLSTQGIELDARPSHADTLCVVVVIFVCDATDCLSDVRERRWIIGFEGSVNGVPRLAWYLFV